jgi:hypothetical protein
VGGSLDLRGRGGGGSDPAIEQNINFRSCGEDLILCGGCGDGGVVNVPPLDLFLAGHLASAEGSVVATIRSLPMVEDDSLELIGRGRGERRDQSGGEIMARQGEGLWIDDILLNLRREVRGRGEARISNLHNGLLGLVVSEPLELQDQHRGDAL